VTERKMTKILDRAEVARSAAGLAVLSTLSPATGLAVEVALAWRLGASSTVDAFRIASTLLLLGWNLFIVEIMPNVIVPIFAECRARRAEQEGWTTAFSVANTFMLPTVTVCALAAAWPTLVVDLLGPGLTGPSQVYAASFVRCFALAVIPLVWSGAAGSILYAYDIFWVPPTASICGNCVLLGVLVGLPVALAPVGLSFAAFVASMCTLIIFGARLKALMRRVGVGAESLLRLQLRDVVARRAIGSCMPLLAMVLINLAGNAVMYRVLSEQSPGSVATFGYASKMPQLVSLAPCALGVVMFPRFAQAHFASTPEGFRAICTKGLRMGLYIVLPLAVACFVLRFPLTQMLFRRGAFSPEAAVITARLFGLLLLAVPATVLYIYLQRISYAVHDTLTPSLIQSAAYSLLILFAPPIGARFGGDGLCLLLVVINWLACALLAHRLSKGHSALDLAEMAVFASELLLLVLASAWAGTHAAQYFLWPPGVLGMLPLMVRITLTSGFTAAIFITLTLMLRFPEAFVWLRHLEAAGSSIVRLAPSRKVADL
jgi:putative peptidoglycan lipid II flippase